MEKKFEQYQKQNEEEEFDVLNILRKQVRILLQIDKDPLEDEEFKRFLNRHSLTEGDVKVVIDEERKKLEEKKKKEEEELRVLRNRR